jgi:hypothetical protein
MFFKSLSRMNLVHNELKQVDVISTLHFNFSAEYAIRKVRENQVGQGLNGLNQVLGCAGGGGCKE